MDYMEFVEKIDFSKNTMISKNDTNPKIAPRFEIVKIRCNSGHENPLMAYDKNFFSFLDEFAKKYQLSENSKKNLMEENFLSQDNLPLCCKLRFRSGQVFSISSKSEKSVTVNKRDISSLPGPLSDGETLSWV